MFKRALSLIICLVMLTSAFAGTGLTLSANEDAADIPAVQPTVAASMNEGFVTPDRASASGTCGDNLTWTLSTSTGVLNITGTGNMTDYSSESYNGFLRTTAPWKSYISSIKSVVIGDSVTSIGNIAFYDCTSLTSVTIPDSVTSIGGSAFSCCTSLTRVSIPDSVTSIGDGAFSGTAYYNNSSNWVNNVLYIGNHLIKANTSISGAYSIKDGTICIADYAFSSCDSLTSVTIPKSVTSIGYHAFYDCTSLTSVTIPDSVTNIGDYAFRYCTSLTSVTIGNSVTSIGDYAFYSCRSLTSVTIPDSVTSIGEFAFYRCDSLTSVYITDIAAWCGITFNGNTANPLYCAKNLYLNNELITDLVIPDSVTSIGSYAFYSCRSLTSVTIPDSVTSIGEFAFCFCDSLTSVTIPDSVTSIGELAFWDCTSLTSVYITDIAAWCGITFNGYSANPLYCAKNLYLNNELITDLVIPDSVTSIGKSAFAGCFSLTSVTIPDSVTSIGDWAFYNCRSLTSVTIPDSVTSIGDDAFSGCNSLTSVTIPDSVTNIGSYAFEGCTSLTSVTIPDSVTSIGDRAFHYYNNGTYYKLDLTIRCYENSYAHTYAKNNGFNYELICNHIFTNYISDNNATCTGDGTKTAYCDNGCGATDIITDEGTAFGHTWSEWIVTIEPTYTTEGEQIRFCITCGNGDGVAIPVLPDPNKPVITVDNFTVTITNAENIKDMRYAPGEYTTTTEIRNAEGNVALDSGVIAANTVDGNFVYEMPNGGIYSIWIRMKDGTNYILPLDVTKVTASVSSYGVKVTIHDIFDVKDIYIAKGEYQTYREIKDNGYIVALSANKIGSKHDYTYTVYEPGVHTVLVRYNDGRSALFHEELTVTEPVFTTNGLQVTVGNIEDVKVIRTAYGEYTTPGDTKRAGGARNFSGKSVIKGAEEYMIQYREDGVVTIVVEYNNGYVKVFHYNVQHKEASCTQSMSSVLLRNLDDFVMIRYAPGEYSTSAEIKRASGSKVIKPADLTGEYAVVSGLAKGTYTFCVQFDDESYNYFVVTVN